jgi:hypothetical protein
MKILTEAITRLVATIAGLSAINWWLGLNPTTWIENLFQGATPEESYEELVNFANGAIAVASLMLIFTFWIWLAKSRARPKGLTYETLADEILKLRKKNMRIELIGYSLGFANPIKFRLQDTSWEELDVTIYTMNEDVILKNFKEQKTLKHRVEVISERLREWQLLETERKIGSLAEVEVSELIPFAAVVIDSDRLFVSNYIWRIENDRLALQKVPAPQRLFFEISNVDGAYETVMAIIKTFRKNVE